MPRAWGEVGLRALLRLATCSFPQLPILRKESTSQITAQPLAPMQPQPHLPSPSPRLPVSSVTVHVSLSAETSLLQVIWRRFTWVVFSSGEKAVHLTHLLFFEWFPSFFMNSDCNCQLADRGFTYGKLAPCKFIVEFINSPIFRCLNRIFRLLLR